MHSRFLGMLGLCAKAGGLVSGEEAVRLAVRRQNAYIVIVDACASANTLDRARALSKSAHIPLLTVDEDIGRAIGKEGRRLIAVTDKALAQTLERIYIEAGCGKQ